MSNNKQQVELADITAPLLEATQGLTMEDRDASTSTIIDCITEVNQTPNYVDGSDDPTGYLLDCAERGQNRGKKPSPSICKVSRILRDHNESSFEPQLVSIGPIHREDPKLQEFEGQKECYLNDLLLRCDSMRKKTLEACLLKVSDKIDEIKKSYAGMIEGISDVELARMMVMDGCFILEFCFKHEDEDEYLPNKMHNLRIAMDLILLENQVPFVVLRDLFDCLAPYIFSEKGSVTLSQVLDTYFAPYIKLFRSLSPEKMSTTDVDHSDSSPAHVLDYLHKRYQLVAGESSKPKHAEASKHVDEELAAKSWNVDDEALRGHTIVELDRSGMNFKPHQEDECSMTIKFKSSLFPCLPWFGSKSTLLMPTMVIHDTTELILRNFIAYEQLLQDRYYFTSYAYAMDKLIDTQEDIAKLVESKVLLNILVSNQVAADMINNICKTLFVTDFYYAREFKQMDKYYNRFWPMIKRTYFSNPWNAINLLFGIIAFVATVVSAIVAVLEYIL